MLLFANPGATLFFFVTYVNEKFVKGNCILLVTLLISTMGSSSESSESRSPSCSNRDFTIPRRDGYKNNK